MQKGTKQTSVEIQEDLFYEFKMTSVRYKMSLKKLVDRSIYLYLTDPDFRNQVNSQTTTTL